MCSDIRIYYAQLDIFLMSEAQIVASVLDSSNLSSFSTEFLEIIIGWLEQCKVATVSNQTLRYLTTTNRLYSFWQRCDSIFIFC